MYGQKYTNCLDSVHHLPLVFHGILQHPILDAFILENKAQIHICLKLCQRHRMQLDICRKIPYKPTNACGLLRFTSLAGRKRK